MPLKLSVALGTSISSRRLAECVKHRNTLVKAGPQGYVDGRHATQLVAGKGAGVSFAVDRLPMSGRFPQITIGTVGPYEAADPLLLDFRFRLSPNTRPGRYAWPLSVTVFVDY